MSSCSASHSSTHAASPSSSSRRRWQWSSKAIASRAGRDAGIGKLRLKGEESSPSASSRERRLSVRGRLAELTITRRRNRTVLCALGVHVHLAFLELGSRTRRRSGRWLLKLSHAGGMNEGTCSTRGGSWCRRKVFLWRWWRRATCRGRERGRRALTEPFVRRRRARPRPRTTAEFARVATGVRRRRSVIARVVRWWTARRGATSARRWEVPSGATTADIRGDGRYGTLARRCTELAMSWWRRARDGACAVGCDEKSSQRESELATTE